MPTPTDAANMETLYNCASLETKWLLDFNLDNSFVILIQIEPNRPYSVVPPYGLL